MAVFETNRRFEYIPVPHNTPSSFDQYKALKKLQEEATTCPQELLLVRTANLYRRQGHGPIPSTANLSWQEYLGIIPLEDPASVLQTDGRNLEVHPEKFATIEHHRRGVSRLVLSTDPIGHMWHKRIDLGALDTPAQTYAGGYLVERYEIRQDPVLEIHVGDEAVKDYMLAQAAKATERSAKSEGWWKRELNADNLLIGYFRLQRALGRVVLPLSPHVEHLMKLQGGDPNLKRKYIDELIQLVEIDPKKLRPAESAVSLREEIINRSKAAVLGDLCTDSSTYSTPLVSGIDGVNRVVQIDQVITSICQNYGIETPLKLTN